MTSEVFKALRGTVKPAEHVATQPLAPIMLEYLDLFAEGVGHTARAKRLDIDRFLEFLKRYRKISEIEHLTVGDWDFSACQHFVDELLKIEAPATVARRLATLKHMGRVLAERWPGFINPVRDVRAPKIQNARPQSLDSEEIDRIKEHASSLRTKRGNFVSYRNEILFYFLLDTGLRADEVRTLKRSQIDDKLEWIRGVKTKGRRFRDAYISSVIRDPLAEYLKARAAQLEGFFPKLTPSIDGRLPVFISTHGARAEDPDSFLMGAKSVWRAIRSYSVETKLHPHLLRHTFAVELLDDSKDIRLVAQALGHSDVRITMRYTERGKEEVAKALERARRNRDS
jgi:integrase/recombinase XerC